MRTSSSRDIFTPIVTVRVPCFRVRRFLCGRRNVALVVGFPHTPQHTISTKTTAKISRVVVDGHGGILEIVSRHAGVLCGDDKRGCHPSRQRGHQGLCCTFPRPRGRGNVRTANCLGGAVQTVVQYLVRKILLFLTKKRMGGKARFRFFFRKYILVLVYTATVTRRSVGSNTHSSAHQSVFTTTFCRRVSARGRNMSCVLML